MNQTEIIKLKTYFPHKSGNETFLQLIEKIGKEHEINGFVGKQGNTVFIYVSGKRQEVESFYKKLGEKLPFSVFFGKAITEAVETFKDENEPFHLKGSFNSIPQNLSPCPSCMEELLNIDNKRFFYPFISCNYCGNQYSYLYDYPFKRENTVFKFFQMCKDCLEEFNKEESRRYQYPLTSCYDCFTPVFLKKGENERYGFDKEKTTGAFKTAAGILKKEGLLKVFTSNGYKLLGTLRKGNIEKARKYLNIGKKPITLLVNNPSRLTEFFHITEEEMKILYSQEKPVIALPFKDFPEKTLISDLSFGFLKAPDEPILIVLSNLLKEEEPFFFIEEIDEENPITDFILGFDLPVINPQKDMKIFTINVEVFIKEGEKGIIPNLIKSRPTGNLSIAGNYAALDIGNGDYLIDTKERVLNQLKDFVDSVNCISFMEEEFDLDIPFKNKKTFRSYEGAILSVFAEHSILEEDAVCLYFSEKGHDVIAVKRNKEIKPLIKIKPIRVYQSLKDTADYVLQEIKNMSEEGEKLVHRWLSKYPLEKRTSEFFVEKESIVEVFNVLAFLLGIFKEEKVSYENEPYYLLTSEALSFEAKRGLRIDYFLEEENGEFYLDWRKIIQSCLSFKLADTSNEVLAFSILEGFKEWIEKEISTVIYKLKLKNAVISGSLFTNPIITGKLLPHFKDRFNLYKNEKLPVDYQNIALGGIFV